MIVGIALGACQVAIDVIRPLQFSGGDPEELLGDGHIDAIHDDLYFGGQFDANVLTELVTLLTHSKALNRITSKITRSRREIRNYQYARLRRSGALDCYLIFGVTKSKSWLSQEPANDSDHGTVGRSAPCP